MFCREQVAQLRDELPRIRELGAELVVVGSGQPEQARDFKAQYALDVPLLVDPSLDAYASAGLRRGIGATLSFRSAKHAVRALAAGARQGRVQGDPWQQGGALIITPAGELAYRYVSEVAGDHPDPRELIAALEAQLSR